VGALRPLQITIHPLRMWIYQKQTCRSCR